jgi:DNA-binding LacI/PurR family transcriptional regulator
MTSNPSKPNSSISARVTVRATSYDVARLAGVSQSAVSRAFREGGSISRRTRDKVEKAARELGYSPSEIARSLITQRSRMIGVIMTDLTARNYPELLRFLSGEIQQTGNRTLLCSVPSDAEAEAAAASLLAFHVDGIVSSASLPQAVVETCARQNVPVVLYNRAPKSPLASSVGCDHPNAMELMVQHLVEGGSRQVIFIAGPAGAPVSRDRLLGTKRAFARRGMALQKVLHGDYSYEEGHRLACQYFGSGDFNSGERPDTERPDTVVCANDTTALGVMDALRFTLKLRIPDDVSVAGFDDVPQAGWSSYDLTTLRQPVRQMTQLSIEVLMEAISGHAARGTRHLLPAELKVRGSTR